MIRKVFICITFLIFTELLTGQDPTFNEIIPNSSTVDLFEKFEVSISLNAAYDNPYDYDDIELIALFTRPDNQKDTIDGFYMEQLVVNKENGNIQNQGPGIF